MTSQVKGMINHNFPVEVVVIQDGVAGREEKPFRKSEGARGSMEIDLWFTGTQEVVIREVQPTVDHHPV